MDKYTDMVRQHAKLNPHRTRRDIALTGEQRRLIAQAEDRYITRIGDAAAEGDIVPDRLTAEQEHLVTVYFLDRYTREEMTDLLWDHEDLADVLRDVLDRAYYYIAREFAAGLVSVPEYA